MSSELKKSRFEGIKPILVKSVCKEDHRPVNEDAQIAFGLVQILNAWVRAQRNFDLEISLSKLTPEQKAFWDLDVNRNGCILPPSAEALPDLDSFDLKKATGLTSEDQEEIKSFVDILTCSYSSWAMQTQSSMNQHNVSIAVGVIQLYRDLDKIYTQFLGENIIWKTYAKVLGQIHKIAPHFLPWHGVLAENRQENQNQMVRAQTHKEEDIGAVVGAGMANTTVGINECYCMGIEKVISAVRVMASHKEKEKGEEFISNNVNSKLKALLQVSISIIQQPVEYFRFADDMIIYLVTGSRMCPTGISL